MSRRAIAFLAVIATLTGTARQNQPPANPPTVIRSTTREVLLDFIARATIIRNWLLISARKTWKSWRMEFRRLSGASSIAAAGRSLHRRTEPRLRPRVPQQIRRRRFARSILFYSFLEAAAPDVARRFRRSRTPNTVMRRVQVG